MDIPVEIFLGFIAISFILIGIGLVRKIPAMIVFAGFFVLTWSVMPDNIIMGQIPTTSTVSGAVTTYEFEPDLFPFTEMVKVIFAFFSLVLILMGALMMRVD